MRRQEETVCPTCGELKYGCCDNCGSCGEGSCGPCGCDPEYDRISLQAKYLEAIKGLSYDQALRCAGGFVGTEPTSTHLAVWSAMNLTGSPEMARIHAAKLADAEMERFTDACAGPMSPTDDPAWTEHIASYHREMDQCDRCDKCAALGHCLDNPEECGA